MNNHEKDRIADLYARGGRRSFVEESRPVLTELIGLVECKRLLFLEANYIRSIDWDVQVKSKLIESFLINIPVPHLVFSSKGYRSPTLVVDGQQRIRTIGSFFANQFSLWDLACWPELNGYYFDDLPREMQHQLKSKKMQVRTILYEDPVTGFSPESIDQITYENLNSFRL